MVLLIKENHFFNQTLGCMHERYESDIDGGDPERPHSNRDRDGRNYFQQPTGKLQMRFDPTHEQPERTAALSTCSRISCSRKA